MAETPVCPRCGYDQRGVIDSWSQSCPLAGICSECGLEFQWRDLLDPRFKIKPMLFEHAQSRYALSFFYTFWRMLRPWSFWRWVRLEDEISPYRLGIFTCISIPLLALGTMLVMIPVVFLLGIIIAFETTWLTPWEVVTYTLFEHSLDYDTGFLLPLLGLTTSIAIAPGILVLIGDSMKLARVRRVHLMRVWVYSLVCVPWAYGLLCFSFLFDWFADWMSNWSSRFTLNFGLFFGEARPTLLFAAGAALVLQMLVIHRAVVSYLRMPSAWGVALSVTAITGLLAAIVAVLPLLWIYRQ